METYTEDQLMELLDYIAGKRKFSFLGNGIHTYPNGNENNIKIYSGCLELEKRKLIYRKIDMPDHVFFVAH